MYLSCWSGPWELFWGKHCSRENDHEGNKVIESLVKEATDGLGGRLAGIPARYVP